MNFIWIPLALAMGACVALQGSVNSSLSAKIGIGTALVINALILLAGSAGLMVLTMERRVSTAAFADVPVYEYMGGILGFSVVTLAILIFPRLGAGLTLALAVSAQIFTGLIIDHFSLFGLTPHSLNIPRLMGVALMISGVVLIKLF